MQKRNQIINTLMIQDILFISYARMFRGKLHWHRVLCRSLDGDARTNFKVAPNAPLKMHTNHSLSLYVLYALHGVFPHFGTQTQLAFNQSQSKFIQGSNPCVTFECESSSPIDD